MCGRFNVIDNPELRALLQELGIDLGLPERANVAPTETIALVRGAGSARELAEVRWWLTPRWATRVEQKYSMFNARCENLAKSRAFREPFLRRRGIVPVSSFIEWRTEDGAKQPYLIEAPGQALALAAVWERWEGDGEVLESCALVTTAAAPGFAHVHNRMPVMLSAPHRERWLDTDHALTVDDALFHPELAQQLRVTPISRAINNARNKDPALLAPVGEGENIAQTYN